MVTIAKRAVGVLLCLAGLGLVVVGGWFALQLGSAGTAQFTVRPTTADPVLIEPDVLNRVDSDVVVTATPAGDAPVWMALANPSDATAVVGKSRHTEVTGVEVRDWALTTTTRGSGESPNLVAADLWRQQDDATGVVTLTVLQSEAPETLVITSGGEPLRSVSLTVVDKTWFVEAVVVALVGLFLLVAGTILLWPHRGRDRAEARAPEDPAAAAEDAVGPASAADGAGSTTEKVTR